MTDFGRRRGIGRRRLTVGGGGSRRNDTGRILVCAHEKANEIKDLNASSGPTITIDFKWGAFGYTRGKLDIEWFCYEHAGLDRV